MSGGRWRIDCEVAPPFASMLAQYLREEGLEVELDSPAELRSITEAIVVASVLSVAGKVMGNTYAAVRGRTVDEDMRAAISRAVARFQAKGRAARIVVHDDKGRLVRLDPPSHGSE